MRTRNLRSALLAALAALLFVAGLAPVSSSEAADEAPEVETITTVLQPGWNMVGWVGPATPTSELFEALPQLQRVSAWDAGEGSYQRAFRGRYAQLPSLTPGVGLWLHLGGDAPAVWTRSVSGEAVLLSLRTGWNLVGWTGDNGTGIDEAVARFGDTFVRGSVWDASAQQYAHYHPGSGNTEPPALSAGDALWLDLTSDARWWQSGTARTEFVFSDGISLERRSEIRKGMADLIAFFAERFGAYAPELTISVSDTEPGCWARPGFLKLVESFLVCPVHEYFHVLQFALAEGRPWGPEWLTEELGNVLRRGVRGGWFRVSSVDRSCISVTHRQHQEPGSRASFTPELPSRLPRGRLARRSCRRAVPPELLPLATVVGQLGRSLRLGLRPHHRRVL